ncbi:hypothetical protein Arub01_59340 [Actinomadura rubrobrunea]|uniref:Uncharacterized protein n=1 Tax=Actinomadura rubrobrunea TaxID=115335 RepID=A0A9W6Q2R0_9ACTN|nr:hypothetical protein [Actinomadura rubrobrunea]GLW67691.1 hypothetical protein Arub01_59340 [Actinomadura rubrobrunea]
MVPIALNVIDPASSEMTTFSDRLPKEDADRLERHLEDLHKQAPHEGGDLRHAVLVRPRMNRTPLITTFRIPEKEVKQIRRIFRGEE